METRLFLEKLKCLADAKTAVRLLPLGVDESGEVVFSHKIDKIERYRHTCVSGSFRAAFIAREIALLSGLYSPRGAAFIILSKNPIYTKLLRLKNADVTVPYIRSKKDLSSVLTAISPLIDRVKSGKSNQRLFLVLDGLETLEKEEDRLLKNYAPFFEATAGLPVEIITGVDFKRTIFSGSPHLFVGEGNCLLTTDEDGVADVTYVEGKDMSFPKKVIYPRMEGEEQC